MKNNIRQIMKEKGITIMELKERTGLAKRTIERARGDWIRECRLSTLLTIADALGVSVTELFDAGAPPGQRPRRGGAA